MDPNAELSPSVGHEEGLQGMAGGMPWKQTLEKPEIGEIDK